MRRREPTRDQPPSGRGDRDRLAGVLRAHARILSVRGLS
jgi:hypothetical protein